MPLSASCRVLTGAGPSLLLLLSLFPPLLRGDNAADGAVEKMVALTVNGAPALPGTLRMPVVTQSVTAAQVGDTINVFDTEDALKYLPSLFLRKRNDGDTQAVLATRTWGLNSSARSLVYADGVLLSALIANNNTIGAPRWGMVTPEEIERIDVLYGPYAAAFPGNSMGAVVEITTRMPEKWEATLAATGGLQSFSLYSTRSTYAAGQAAVTAGDRIGRWSFWLSAGEENSETQPLLFVTAATLPAGTTGGFIAANKLGQPADVLGASGIQHSIQAGGKFKIACDLSPSFRATYALGVWDDDTHAIAQTYLRDTSGLPTYAGIAAFASGTYEWGEEHTMQSLTLKSRGSGQWNWEFVGSLYDFDKDTQKSPGTASATGTNLSPAGKVALLGGTGWSTLDARAAWNPDGHLRPRRGFGGQELSFGAHYDRYELVNPTFNTPDWRSGRTFSSLSTEGDGSTSTAALWMQDAWSFAPGWKATAGGRQESWRAFDGVNASGGVTIQQPREASSDFSPKGTLAWSPAREWTIAASVGNAHRYPTAAELYQLVSTGTTFTSPNPDLRPERVWSAEVRAERAVADGFLRLTLFNEDTADALVSQYDTLVPGSSTQYQYVMNVGKIRNRGAEFSLDRKDALVAGLELSCSVTWVDSRILADSGKGQLSGAVGKRAPYVPEWRATFAATCHPAPSLAWTLAGRYSGRQYSTVDNTDVNPDVFGGFDEFFVLDTRLHWTVGRRWTGAAGVDNLLDRRYFLFHPFPQRTVVAELKCAF